jgi:mannose/fructose/N-acetylgalactosamine-specific phosphotransferase system component IID
MPYGFWIALAALVWGIAASNKAIQRGEYTKPFVFLFIVFIITMVMREVDAGFWALVYR